MRQPALQIKTLLVTPPDGPKSEKTRPTAVGCYNCGMAHELLTREESLALSSALLDLSVAGRRLSNSTVGQLPLDGTQAAKQLLEPVNGGAMYNGPVRRAHEGMLFASLAGWDHANAFAQLLRRPVPATVSIATVARGGVEALSRAHWMLSAQSTNEMVRRQFSIAIGDLNYFLKHTPKEPLRTPAGGKIDAVSLRANLTSTLSDLNIGDALSTKPTGLAVSFLDAVLGGGTLKYSRLSSVAHAESYSVHSFVDFERMDEKVVTLALPRNVAIEYAGYLIVGGALVGDMLVDLFGSPLLEHERWSASRQRAVDAFKWVDETRDST